MRIIKKLCNILFGNTNDVSISLSDFEDSELQFKFKVDDKNYLLDLNWDSGIMDIEFSYMGNIIPDTTDFNHPFKLVNKVSEITNEMAKVIEERGGDTFHSIIFKSSNFRNNNIDTNSALIRDRLFIRHVTSLYPNSKIIRGDGNKITIKLYGFIS